MNPVRQILYTYIDKQKFNFQKIFDVRQSKSQILLLLDQMVMFIDGGMDAKQIMYTFNGVLDNSLQGVMVDVSMIREIRKNINKSKISNQSSICEQIKKHIQEKING